MFFFGCSEVNSTWLITSELANQRARKALFSCVVYTYLGYSPVSAWGILVTLRNVSRRASCKALGWDKVITIGRVCIVQYRILVYTTQVNSTFRAHWLASSEVISQVLFTSKQPKKNKMAFVCILSQIKLLFGPLVIQLVYVAVNFWFQLIL